MLYLTKVDFLHEKLY